MEILPPVYGRLDLKEEDLELYRKNSGYCQLRIDSYFLGQLILSGYPSSLSSVRLLTYLMNEVKYNNILLLDYKKALDALKMRKDRLEETLKDLQEKGILWLYSQPFRIIYINPVLAWYGNYQMQEKVVSSWYLKRGFFSSKPE